MTKIMEEIIEQVAGDAIADARAEYNGDDSETLAEMAAEIVSNAYGLDVLAAYEEDGISREEIRSAVLGKHPTEACLPIYNAAFEILEG